MTSQDQDPVDPFEPQEFAARMLEQMAAEIRAGTIQPWSSSSAGSLEYAQRVLAEDQKADRPEHLRVMLLTYIDPMARGACEADAFSRLHTSYPTGPEGFDKGSRSGRMLEPTADDFAVVRLLDLVNELRGREKMTWRGFYDGATPTEVARLAVFLEREYHDLPGLKLFVLPYIDNSEFEQDLEIQTPFEGEVTPETMQALGEQLVRECVPEGVTVEVSTATDPDRLVFVGTMQDPERRGMADITFDAVAACGEPGTRELLEDFLWRLGDDLCRSLTLKTEGEPELLVGRSKDSWHLTVVGTVSGGELRSEPPSMPN